MVTSVLLYGYEGSTQRWILEIAKERKMQLFGHVTRHPEDLELAHTIVHGHVTGKFISFLCT